MNWYKFIKMAAPQNKVKSLGVTDPFDIAYIYKYEGTIPWQQITDLQSFSEYLTSEKTKLKDYIKQIEPENTQRVLENWATLLDKWNVSHALNESGFLLVMRPIVEWASKHRAPPPAVMPKVVYSIIDNMAQTPTQPINFLKEYQKQAVYPNRETGWYGFGDNVPAATDLKKAGEIRTKDSEKLALFVQGSGWCLSDPAYSKQYLEKGPVYIYIENNEPVAAIATNVHEEKRRVAKTYVSEVRGKFNNVPFDYINQISKKIKESKLRYFDGIQGGGFATLLALNNVVKNFYSEDINKKQSAINDFNRLLNATYTMIGFFFVLPKEIQNDPFVKDQVIKKITEYIDSNGLYIISRINRKFLLVFPKEISDAINKKAGSGSVLDKPEDLPPEIEHLIDWRKQTSGWVRECINRPWMTILENVPTKIIGLFNAKQLTQILITRYNSSYSFDGSEREKIYSFVKPDVAQKTREALGNLMVKGAFISFVRDSKNDFYDKYKELDQEQKNKFITIYGKRVIDHFKKTLLREFIKPYISLSKKKDQDAIYELESYTRTYLKVYTPEALSSQAKTEIDNLFASYNLEGIKDIIKYELV